MSRSAVDFFLRKKMFSGIATWIALLTFWTSKTLNFFRSTDRSKFLSFMFIGVLLVTTVKSYEVEFCSANVSTVRNSDSPRILEKVTTSGSGEAANKSKAASVEHNFCHQNHICKLIFLKVDLFDFVSDFRKGPETFLAPPKEPFFEGPFKPPKFAVSILSRFYKK